MESTSILNGNGDVNGRHAANSRTSLSTPDQDLPDLSPITSPPYWTQSHSRSFSNVSVESTLPGGIVLRDNTEDERDDKNSACWAKGVHIDDFVIISGGLNGLGSFVVWNITIETLNVSAITRVSPYIYT